MALRALDDHRRPIREKIRVDQLRQDASDPIRLVGRIEKDEIERGSSSQASNRLLCIAANHLRSSLQVQGREVFSNDVQGADRSVHQHCGSGPPGKSLDRKRTRPGEQIQDPAVSKIA